MSKAREEVKRILMDLFKVPEGGRSEPKIDALVTNLELLVSERAGFVAFVQSEPYCVKPKTILEGGE